MTQQDESNRPKVGVGLLIFKNGTHVLLGKRINSHGEGEFAGVGGHMENGESYRDTAMREMREEIGDEIQITEPRILVISNVRKYAPKHYIDIGMTAEWVSGEAKLMEPHKFASWGWCPLDELPKPLFEFVKIYLDVLKTGEKFIEL